jgi:hypothetical protein
MSVVSQYHGLKFFAPIALSRLYEQRALFTMTAASIGTHMLLPSCPRPSVHMPKEASPGWSRVRYDKPRTRSKSEHSPSSKEKHAFLNRHADNTPAAQQYFAEAKNAKTPPPKSISAGLAY